MTVTYVILEKRRWPLQSRNWTLARINHFHHSVITDKTGKQSSPLCPLTQTNHLNPESALLYPDTKGSHNALLEANYINTLLSLNCLSPRAQPFSTLMSSHAILRHVFEDAGNKCRGVHAWQAATSKMLEKPLLPASIKLMKGQDINGVQQDNCVGQVSERKRRKMYRHTCISI